MLEEIKSFRLPTSIKMSEWSPKMDIIAIVYIDDPTVVELRRMDWTKVNTISIGSDVTLLCFSSNGRSIYVATTNNEMISFNIENGNFISHRQYHLTITAIANSDCNGINITAVGFEDRTVSILSGWSFTLSIIQLSQAVNKISFNETDMFLLLEDNRTIIHYALPFVKSESVLINSVSSILSSYWSNYLIVSNAINAVNDIWNRIWDECAPFENSGPDLAKCFLIGTKPPDLSTEMHCARLQKSVLHELSEIKNLISEKIIPSLIELDTYNDQFKIVLAISPKLDYTYNPESPAQQLKDALINMQNIEKLRKCFNTFFSYLQNPSIIIGTLEQTGISAAMFSEFLVKYLYPFPLYDVTPPDGPEITVPPFEALQIDELSISSRYSCMSGSTCVCLGEKITAVELLSQETTEYSVDGQPIYAYPFDDGCIGCFYQSEEKPMFIMFNGENDSPHEVSLANASIFRISPRRIALVETEALFCAVVDLEAYTEDDEGGGENEEEEEA